MGAKRKATEAYLLDQVERIAYERALLRAEVNDLRFALRAARIAHVAAVSGLEKR